MLEVLHVVALIVFWRIHEAVEEQQFVFFQVVDQIADERAAHIVVFQFPDAARFDGVAVVDGFDVGEHRQVHIVDAHERVGDARRDVFPAQLVSYGFNALFAQLLFVGIGQFVDKYIAG